MDDTNKNIEEYNLNKKRKILIIFHDMIADMLSNKKLNPVVTELFVTYIKLNISLVLLLNQRILDKILCTILVGKFQTKDTFNKLALTIHQILKNF